MYHIDITRPPFPPPNVSYGAESKAWTDYAETYSAALFLAAMHYAATENPDYVQTAVVQSPPQDLGFCTRLFRKLFKKI